LSGEEQLQKYCIPSAMDYSGSDPESDEDSFNCESDESYRESDRDERSREKKKKAVVDDEEGKLPNLCDYMIDREYRRSWQFQDGIRELVQNMLDGAFVFAEDKFGIESPREIKLLSSKRRSKSAAAIRTRKPTKPSA